jgi:hypothetical protein
MKSILVQIEARHVIRIIFIIGLTLLVIAANVDDPSAWLIVPGWIAIIIFIYAKYFFDSIEKIVESPYKRAFILLFIPCLFFLPLFENAFDLLGKVLAQPSLTNLYRFLTCRGCLLLIALYFAFVCLWLQAKYDDLKNGTTDYKLKDSDNDGLY